MKHFRVADGKSPISRCRGGSTALTSIRDAIPLSSLISNRVHLHTQLSKQSATDFTLTAGWSGNLTQWRAQGLTTEIVGDPGDVRILEQSLPTNQEPRLFLRLRASR